MKPNLSDLTRHYEREDVPLFVHRVNSNELNCCTRDYRAICRFLREHDLSHVLEEFRLVFGRLLFTFKNSPISFDFIKDTQIAAVLLEVFYRAKHQASAGGENLQILISSFEESLGNVSTSVNPILHCYKTINLNSTFDAHYVVQKFWFHNLPIDKLAGKCGIPLLVAGENTLYGSKACYFGDLQVYQFRMKDSFLLSPSFSEIHFIGYSRPESFSSVIEDASLDFIGKSGWTFKPVSIEPVDRNYSNDDEVDTLSQDFSHLRRKELLDRLLQDLQYDPFYSAGGTANAEVTATAFLVPGNKILFLREQGRPKILTVNGGIEVQSTPTAEIVEGDIVLQRSESADVRSELDEDLHNEWKDILRRYLDLGLGDEILGSLKSLGRRVSKISLSNWAGDQHGPNDFSIFKDLISVLGLEQAEERWALISVYRDLGHSAGFKATAVLCEKFAKLSTLELQALNEGKVVEKFINDHDRFGAAMFAVKIEAVFARSIAVRQHMIGRILPIPEDIEWR